MSFEEKEQWAWLRRSDSAISQGALTNSKRPSSFIKGVYPTHLTHGQGAFVYDYNQKKYLDYIGANGTCIFGYANPHLINTIQAQLYRGWLLPLGSTLEVEAAEQLKSNFPFVRKVRFLKSGTEACLTACRIAMAHTGRSKVLSSGYHGWGDGFVSLTPPACGVPKQPSYESFTDLAQIKTDVACVIIEPILTVDDSKRREWLQLVVDKCRKNGVLVIFDEIITGFRWPRLSFSTDSGIHPDIILLGKACASGLPLAIVGLGEHVGDNSPWFVSGTYHGEMLSLSVLIKTFELLRNEYKIDELWRDGSYFIEEFNAIWPEKLKLEGYPTRGVFKGDDMVKALFFQETCKAGLLFGASWFYSYPHIEYRQQTISTIKDIMLRIRNNQVKLEGDLPASPFAQQVREKS